MIMTNKFSIKDIKVHSPDLDQPLARILILLFNSFESELISKLKSIGYPKIKQSDLNILRFIPADGITVVEIAKLANITKQAVGKQVHYLESCEYIKKENHPTDNRSQIISFTPKGEKLVNEMIQIIAGIETKYSEILGIKKLNEIKSNLAKLYKFHDTNQDTFHKKETDNE